jgi:hypothetical protein
MLLEEIDDAETQGNLRSDEGQIYSFPARKFQKLLDTLGWYWDDLRLARNTAIAWRCEDLLDFRIASQRIHNRVFAAPGSDNKDFHFETFKGEMVVSTSFKAPVR